MLKLICLRVRLFVYLIVVLSRKNDWVNFDKIWYTDQNMDSNIKILCIAVVFYNISRFLTLSLSCNHCKPLFGIYLQKCQIAVSLGYPNCLMLIP